MDRVELRQARKRLGLRQDDLACRLGVSKRWLCAVELGERPVPPWYVLAVERLLDRAG